MKAATRLAAAFVLDLATLARGDRHVLDTLLMAAISQANVAPISQQGDLQVAYSGAEDVPPDEMRRPISINAVAVSLGLPFETVRRRVKAMIDRGHCVARDGGVVIPSAVYVMPEYLQNAFAAYERLRRFYYELRDLGLTAALPPPTVRLDAASFPIRTVARLVTDYMLRVIEALMRQMGDVIDVLIVLQVFRINTAGFVAGETGREGFEADDLMADRMRKPAPSSKLAQALGLPQETVRRHVETLLESGRLERVKGGLIVPARVLAQPKVREGLADNFANLQRLFGSLSQLGVLGIWDELDRPSAHAAAASV